jgi:hypothetical protein
VDRERAIALRELLAPTGWVDRTRTFANSLRRSRAGRTPGGLLLVGTPSTEPWHLTAHLDDEARWFDIPELAPTLVRWSPPQDAPAHLAVGLTRLEKAERGETVVVVAPDDPTAPLLERVSDARRGGVVILAVDAGDSELEDLAHESLVVPPNSDEGLITAAPADVPPVSFDVVTHLVSVAAGEPLDEPGSRGLRRRLARFLDAVAGPDRAPPGN